MRDLASGSFHIIIADPPYQMTRKDFGNDSDRQDLLPHLTWTDAWVAECLRLLHETGTLYVYGFPEVMAHTYVRIADQHPSVQCRFLVWHYKNKVCPSFHGFQRSHESILRITKSPHALFHRDSVRVPYSKGYRANIGKVRAATPGRFSKGDLTTIYEDHGGALPRDVIEVPALVGRAGTNERVDHPTQKPLALCDTLLKAALRVGDPPTRVLVPFAGSGSELVAAQRLGCETVAFELNPEYVTLCKERLKSNT